MGSNGGPKCSTCRTNSVPNAGDRCAQCKRQTDKLLKDLRKPKKDPKKKDDK